jgi:hypothetical protein
MGDRKDIAAFIKLGHLGSWAEAPAIGYLLISLPEPLIPDDRR